MQDVPRGSLISSCTHHTFTRFISQSDANAEIVAAGRKGTMLRPELCVLCGSVIEAGTRLAESRHVGDV